MISKCLQFYLYVLLVNTNFQVSHSYSFSLCVGVGKQLKMATCPLWCKIFVVSQKFGFRSVVNSMQTFLRQRIGLHLLEMILLKKKKRKKRQLNLGCYAELNVFLWMWPMILSASAFFGSLVLFKTEALWCAGFSSHLL